MGNHLQQMLSQVNASDRANLLHDESDDSFAGRSVTSAACNLLIDLFKEIYLLEFQVRLLSVV